MANTGTGFVVSNGTTSAPAAFIFDTLDGHIEAWNPKVDPLIGNTENKATVPGASYTGLALAASSHGDELFAANFGQGKVDVFDSTFKQVKTAPWQFRDSRAAARLQALQHAGAERQRLRDLRQGRPEHGQGKRSVRASASSTSSAPTGALSPASPRAVRSTRPGAWPSRRPAGFCCRSLLIGNFGDGRINIVAEHGRHFANHITGQVVDKSTGKPFTEPGLWALLPGTAANGGTNALWFTSGINHEQDGCRRTAPITRHDARTGFAIPVNEWGREPVKVPGPIRSWIYGHRAPSSGGCRRAASCQGNGARSGSTQPVLACGEASVAGR